MSFPFILSSFVSLSSKLLEAGQVSPRTMQVLQQRISDFNDYQIHSMNNNQSKYGSITQRNKRAMQENVIKGKKNSIFWALWVEGKVNWDMMWMLEVE